MPRVRLRHAGRADSETFGYVHLSAGDLLREEKAKEGSALKDVIESCIAEGKLVPEEIIVKLIEQKMRAVGWAGGKYLIDGFPRSQENLDGWAKVIEDSVTVEFCLFFDVSEAVMTERLLERGKTSGRSDDNTEAIKKRFVTFRSESLPIIEMYRASGSLVDVNAERSIDAVWEHVQVAFREGPAAAAAHGAAAAKPSVVFVLGGPGSGKGTQCARISE